MAQRTQNRTSKSARSRVVRGFVHSLGALSYLFGLVAYALALGVVAAWMLAAVGAPSPEVAPYTGTVVNGSGAYQPTIIETAVTIVVVFAAILGSVWAMVWGPIMVSRSASKWTHRIAGWVAPGYTAWMLLGVKAGLYAVPVVILLGAQLTYYTALDNALLISGVAAWVVGVFLACMQTIMSAHMNYKTEKIF